MPKKPVIAVNYFKTRCVFFWESYLIVISDLGSISAAHSGPTLLPEKRLFEGRGGETCAHFSEQRLVIEPIVDPAEEVFRIISMTR